VTLRVLNAAGREVGRLVWPSLEAGPYTIRRPARGKLGQPLPAGVYWIQMECHAGTRTARWVTVR
jgi:hypothetical protein